VSLLDHHVFDASDLVPNTTSRQNQGWNQIQNCYQTIGICQMGEDARTAWVYYHEEYNTVFSYWQQDRLNEGWYCWWYLARREQNLPLPCWKRPY
jgi:hypothetical protein